MSDSDSDYVVEEFVKPDKIGAPLINDESADLLGNFDDSKRKRLKDNYDPFGNENSDEDDQSDDDDEDPEPEESEDNSETEEPQSKKPRNENNEIDFVNGNHINDLMRGVSKSNRHVLYVTNLNFATTKETLTERFNACGQVKCVRIPKNRKGGFAFVEMETMDGFKVHFKCSFYQNLALTFYLLNPQTSPILFSS